MDFQITEEHVRLQQRCRQLADLQRAALHDREATDPVENYALLRQAGSTPPCMPHSTEGGHTCRACSLAAEELCRRGLAQGWSATAFWPLTIHPCMVGPHTGDPSPAVSMNGSAFWRDWSGQATLAGRQTSPPPPQPARHIHAHGTRRVDGGYRITGRKAFASMIEAADYCIVVVHPGGSDRGHCGMLSWYPIRRRGASQGLGHPGYAGTLVTR